MTGDVKEALNLAERDRVGQQFATAGDWREQNGHSTGLGYLTRTGAARQAVDAYCGTLEMQRCSNGNRETGG